MSHRGVPEIERLVAGPENVELSDSELALVEAYLQQPISFAELQREAQTGRSSESSQRRMKLKFIRDFNRKLRALTRSANTSKMEPQGGSLKPEDDTTVDEKLLQKRKRAGRKPARMTKEEKRIWDMWNSGAYKTYSDLDWEEKLEDGTVEATLNKLRQRERRTKRTK